MRNNKAVSDVVGFADEILNAALTLSLEWGENFLKPIQSRLQAAYPQITNDQANLISAWCDAVKDYAFAVVEKDYPLILKNEAGTAIAQIKEKYPQLSDETLSRLHNQGMYYAWHG